MQDNETPRNIKKARTQGAICLGLSGNQKNWLPIYESEDRKKITRYSWDEIPIPDTVIDRVNKLRESQPEYFIFADRRGRQIVGFKFTGVDGEITEAPLQIQNVENHDLSQPDVIDEELAAQPEQ